MALGLDSFTDVSIEEFIRRDAKRRNGVGQIVVQDTENYRRSLRPHAVAKLKKEWLAKMARAAARAAKKAIASAVPRLSASCSPSLAL